MASTRGASATIGSNHDDDDDFFTSGALVSKIVCNHTLAQSRAILEDLTRLLASCSVGSVYPFGAAWPSSTSFKAAWKATLVSRLPDMGLYILSLAFCWSTTLAISLNTSLISPSETRPCASQFAISCDEMRRVARSSIRPTLERSGTFEQPTPISTHRTT